MVRWFIVVCLALLLAVSYVQPVVGQFSLLPIYDTFDSRRIDPARWIVRVPRLNYETTVEQVRGRLKIESQGYGRTDTNFNLNESGRILFSIPENAAALLKAIQVTARIEDSDVTGCAANTQTGRSAARLSATLFNDGSSTGETDRTGDVHTFIDIDVFPDAPKGPFPVVYIATRCNDQCSNQTPIQVASFGSVELGQDLTLRIEWMPASSQIVFSATNHATGATQTAVVPYGFATAVAIPPRRQFKELDVFHRLENCTSVRTNGWIKVSFDDFRAGP